MALIAAALSVVHIILASFGIASFPKTLTEALAFYGVIIGYWATMATIEDGFGKR